MRGRGRKSCLIQWMGKRGKGAVAAAEKKVEEGFKIPPPLVHKMRRPYKILRREGD